MAIHSHNEVVRSGGKPMNLVAAARVCKHRKREREAACTRHRDGCVAERKIRARLAYDAVNDAFLDERNVERRTYAAGDGHGLNADGISIEQRGHAIRSSNGTADLVGAIRGGDKS